MNAEALIGTVLGTCTLQKVIGQGGMGAVYLAQQSRPRRQVAVKVLMPMTPLTAERLAAFLERFRRETDAAASLEHPHIVPAHEYGEQNGLAYLVMPYVAGGTLRDEMEREGQLSLSKVVNYLEQLALALDFAHERGVIHRDIKPTNILMTPTGRLLLTDFGLVKIVAAEQAPQVSLTGGMLVGTPDYMAPEQVTGDQIDGRTDLYALGVVLYQMLTGATPFQGGTPMQIAARHLQTPPPSPRLLRPELPIVAEQVVLRALAKRPVDRYNHAQDLANAFRIALESAGLALGYSQASLLFPESVPARSFKPRPRGLFDPAWQAGGKEIGEETALPAPVALNTIPTTPPIGNIEATPRPAPEMPEQPEKPAPVAQPRARGSLGLRTSLRRISDEVSAGPSPAAQPGRSDSGQTPLPATAAPSQLTLAPIAPISQETPDVPRLAWPAEKSPMMTAGMTPFPTATSAANEQAATAGGSVTRALPANNITRILSDPGVEAKGDGGVSSTMKLTAAVKVVKVPVAGQPGRFVTGLLPVAPETKLADTSQSGIENSDVGKLELPAPGFRKRFDTLDTRTKVVAVALAVLLVLGSSLLWLARTHSGQVAGQPTKRVHATPNLTATMAAQATATTDANIILADDLSHNIHNWLVSTSGTRLYVFKDGAYHITDNDDTQSAPALLQDMPPSILHVPLSYSLTMEEIKGDDTSVNNSFGLIFRFSTTKTGGKLVTIFYTFEVTNTPGGEYQFWKYDDQYASSTVTPWTKIWHQNFGKEFHEGHGSGRVNTFKVFMNGSNFTFYVNGKKVGSAHDNSSASGQVGMLVNLKGTEVAFTNFLLAYH
jgi:serine/threonine protein kinase